MSDPEYRLFQCDVVVRVWKRVYVVARSSDDATEFCTAGDDNEELIDDVKDEEPEEITVTECAVVSDVPTHERKQRVFFSDDYPDDTNERAGSWGEKTAKVLADEAKAERDAAANVPLPLTLAEVFE